jgi:hypothetical protein
MGTKKRSREIVSYRGDREMSTDYKRSEDVPTTLLTSRLRYLAEAITKSDLYFSNAFNMHVPAEFDRDADLVLAEAARRLIRLEGNLDYLMKRLGLEYRKNADGSVDIVDTLAFDLASKDRLSLTKVTTND